MSRPRQSSLPGAWLGAGAFLGGALALGGWLANVPRLTDWDANGISMMPNATVCAMGAGAGLVALACGARRWLVAALGIFVALIGAATLSEHASGLALGIDQIIVVPEWGQRAVVAPGRMGPPASTSWMLLGLALALAVGEVKAQRAAVVGALLAAAISLLSLVGYAFGADPLFLIPKLTAIALQTATMIFGLSLGVLAALPDRTPLKLLRANTTAGLLGRRALPLVLVLPIALGWLRVKGQEAALFDTAFGTAMLVLVLIALLVGLLWWALVKIAGKEEALHREKARATETLESITDGYHVIDAEARFTHFNEAAKKMFAAQGLDADALIGSHMVEDVFPDARELPAIRALRRTLAERVPTEAENFYPAWQRWFSVRHYPTAEGGVSTFFADITERKHGEEALRDSEAQMSAATSAGAVGTWNWELVPNTLTANPALLRIFGLESADGGLSPEAFIAAILPADQPPVRAAIARALAADSDGVYEVEYRVRDVEGKVRWVFARGRVERDAARQPLRLPGALTDITERKHGEEQLRRSAELLNVIIDRSPTGFYIVAADFRISHMNADSQARAFRNVRPAIGRPLDEAMRVLWPEPLATEIIHIFRHTLETGEPYRSPGLISPREDLKTLETYEWQLERITMPDGSRSVVCHFYDTTALREAELAMRAAREEAELASRAKDNFLAQLSHELRTPLTPVLMTAAALREDGRLPAEVRGELAMIARNVALEARLIDDLLDLTRVTRGKLVLRTEPCDAHALIALAVEIVRDEAREKQITLTLELGAARRRLEADPARLQQVFWNLLRNAVKFTPRGGHVRIHSHDGTCETNNGDGGQRVCIAVSDDGIGFSAAEAGRLFEPFHQADTTHGTGLGLGLAIARAVVDLHHGHIRGESEGPGRGATFTVELPAEVLLAAQATAPAATPAPESEPERPLRLLLVEDHEATRQVLSRLLTRAGHAVTTAGTVAEAQAAARAQSFDLAISDLGLPDGTGHELMSGLRAVHGLRGIALSGYGMEEDVRRSEEAGFVAHLVKPVDVNELRRVLRRVTA